jgi:uroporphyrinogen-III synthase
MPAALKTQMLLAELGLQAKIMPLLAIKQNGFTISQPYDYIIITSINAAQALLKQPSLSAKILAVGDKSRDLLSQAGYEIALNASTAAQLFIKIKEAINPRESLLYLRGSHIAFPLEDSLKTLGYNIKSQEVYQAHALKQLPPDALKAIAKILFYSPRTAQVFKAICTDSVENITAYCISANCAYELNEVGFKEIKIARQPNENAIIELICKER